MRLLRIVVSLAALGILLAPTPAFAHRMDVEKVEFPEADPTGMRLVVGYDTKEPAEDATVKLLDASGNVVAEGKTDERGVCRLARPAPGVYTITVDDGAGHRCKRQLPVPAPEEPVADPITAEPRNRWLTTAIGLGVITAVTLLFMRWKRAAAAPNQGA